MYQVVDRRTSTAVKSYATQRGALIAMRAFNKSEGYAERLCRAWTNGQSIEWCRKTVGFLAPQHTYAYGPYAVEHCTQWVGPKDTN
jgi:hypothetical protein